MRPRAPVGGRKDDHREPGDPGDAMMDPSDSGRASSPHVRAARRVDRAEWLRMRNALVPSADHEGEIDDYFRSRHYFAVFVHPRPDGTLGGFVEVGLRDYAEGCRTSPVGYLEMLYVDEDLRGHGVARALVAAAEAWARERGACEMASDALIDNEAAIAMHRALGYDEVERIVCFRKTLDSGARG